MTKAQMVMRQGGTEAGSLIEQILGLPETREMPRFPLSAAGTVQ